MRDLASMLWWVLLYPLAAAVAAAGAAAVYYVTSFVVGLPSVSPVPFVSLLVVIVPSYVAAGLFVRVSGAFAPTAKTGVASAACGITLIAALLGWNRLHVPAAWPVAAPLALGALVGLSRTYRAQQRRTRSAPAPDSS